MNGEWPFWHHQRVNDDHAMTINDPISHFGEANGDVEPEPSMVLAIPTDGMQLTMDGEKGRSDAWEKGRL